MAEIKSFPNNQDVYVGAEWVMKWLHGRTSGVFGAENNLATSIVPGTMSVQFSDGVGWLSNDKGDGIVFWNDNEQTNGSKLTLTHDVADGVLDRIDRVVVTWETTNYVALPTVSILKGTASSNPVAPSLTNNNVQRQISLAKVSIPAGTVSLSPTMLTDERLDPEVCGIVTETVRVDTGTMQSQFEALLKAIQLELQNLNAGTAALLKTGDTMQGILNMGGNKITNVATPTDENDAVPKKILDASLNGKLSMKLLWKNASPSSDFAEQTLSLDFSRSKCALIRFRDAKNLPNRTYTKQIFKGHTDGCSYAYTSNSGMAGCMRTASVLGDGSGISFGPGWHAVGADAEIQDDGRAVPEEIYEIF